jgi:hypothetical protein
MTHRRFSIGPGTGIAILALFFALGGSAFAVGERIQSSAAAQQRCQQGAVRGIAHVTGGPSGAANIPGNFSGARSLFARRFNCTGRAIQVRRLGIGVYEVRFVGNGAATALAGGVPGAVASADNVGGGTFRVHVHPVGRDDPGDLPFVLVAV